MMAAALCGFAVAGGVTFLLPDDKFADLLARLPFAGMGAAAGLLAWAVLRGGRAAWRRPHYGWWALAGGALGAIAAGLAAYAIPVRYESTAVLQMYPTAGTMTPAEGARELFAEVTFAEVTNEVLSRWSLSELVLRPSLDLYPGERQRLPMEDIIENMRANDLHIDYPFKTSNSPGPILPVRISFTYPDRFKAQAAVREIVTRIFEGNGQIERRRNRGETREGTIVTVVLDPASLPKKPLFPQSATTLAAAAGAGALLAWVLAFLLRRQQGQAAISWRQALRMMVAALCGFAVAGGVTFLLPDDKFADLVARLPFAGLGAAAGVLGWAVVRGGRAAWRRPHYGWSALAGGALGAIAAGMVAYAIPVRYESTAVLQMYAATKTATPAEDARERFAEIRDEVLSRSSLSELVFRPSLDLYPGERKRRAMEEIVGNMRANDLHIEHTFKTSSSPGPILPVRISFTYPDRFKAQAVVREIVTKILEGNVQIQRRRNRGETHTGAIVAEVPGVVAAAEVPDIVAEVLDPASLPEEPLFPQSAATMAAAAGAGALLAWVLAFLRRRPQGQAAAMLKMGAVGAAAGALLAGAIAFAIPARYVSTAVLRISPGTGGKISARHVADYVRQETPVILSRSSLRELIQRPELDLYRGEQARHPLEQAIDRMREDLRIEPPAPARLAATFSIAFTYIDRFKAQAVVRELVSMFMESQTKYVKETPVSAKDLFTTDLMKELAAGQMGSAIEQAIGSFTADPPKDLAEPSVAPWRDNEKPGSELDLTDGARLEVLDPASLPEAPVWPPRGGIIIRGLLAGLLLGLAAVHIFARERAAGGAALGHQDLVDAADAFLEAERGSGQP
jgi:hypothetical protein